VRLPAPFALAGEHVAIDLPGARALFTTRRGGVSAGAYASLNLGLLSDDDPAAVAVNLERAAALAGVERERLALGRQVHGVAVRAHAAPPDPGAPLQDADGQATTAAGVAPAVLVADCLPIALAGTGAVGMLHAGWRGLADGIVAEGARALRALGAAGPLVAVGAGRGLPRSHRCRCWMADLLADEGRRARRDPPAGRRGESHALLGGIRDGRHGTGRIDRTAGWGRRV